MADHGRFVFVDEWQLGTSPEVLWSVVTDLDGWPQWWPSLRRVTRLSATPTASGEVSWEFRFRTRLPYDMAFVADIRSDDPRLAGGARVTGQVAGEASWQVVPVAGGAKIRFDWEVRPLRAWMRAVSPLARPVFAWNHRSLMAEAAFGLARRLDTTLLAAPVGELRPVSAR